MTARIYITDKYSNLERVGFRVNFFVYYGDGPNPCSKALCSYIHNNLSVEKKQQQPEKKLYMYIYEKYV